MRAHVLRLKLLVLMALPFVAIHAQERVVVSGESACMFKAPSFDGASSPVAKGATLTVLERKENWVRVYDGRTDGFIHAAFLAAVPAPQTAAPAPAPVPTQVVAPPAYPVQPGYPQGVYPMPGYPTQPQVSGVRQPGMVGYKDPTMAKLFGFLVVGGGHFYSGETGKGVGLAALGYGSIIGANMVIAMSANDCVDDLYSGNYEGCDDTGSWGMISLLGLVGFVGTWIYGIVDADNAANRVNAKPMRFGVSPMIQSDGRSISGGLQFRVR